jgi:hypothetical protein
LSLRQEHGHRHAPQHLLPDAAHHDPLRAAAPVGAQGRHAGAQLLHMQGDARGHVVLPGVVDVALDRYATAGAARHVAQVLLGARGRRDVRLAVHSLWRVLLDDMEQAKYGPQAACKGRDHRQHRLGE